ncbi:hypothetical protein Tco_1321099 [Tanacetum coccineum]
MTKHKSISKREGSPYHLVDKDEMLDRLKFINKGDIYQFYGKSILDVFLTKEIKDSNAYKMFFGYSTGLIPPKKGRGRGSQEGKSTATPKEPTKPRKKPLKKKQVPRDESPKSKGELENRQVSRKIRTSRVVVIQEPPSAPPKKTKESSGKLKGIEMLSEAAQLELETQKTIKESQRTSRLKHKTGSSSEGTGVSPGVPDELTGKSALSDEGVGISPKVPDETEYDYEAQSDDDVWGSTDEEKNKDKNEDDVSEEEENEGKTVAETEEEETANSEHEEDDTKGDDQKSEDEPKGDDQATEAEVGVSDLVKIKEKSEFLQSTSSHLISLIFGNQFLVNSPNASLIGTNPENTDKEITSMMDIEIQQDVPLVQNEPFHKVKVSVITETTQQPPSTPPTPPLPAIEDPAAPVINFESVDSFLKKFHALEKDVQEVKQADHSAAILDSIRSQVPSVVKDYLGTSLPDAFQKVLRSHAEELKNEVSMKKEEYEDFIQETVSNEVKNQMSKILPKVVSDFATPVIQSTIKESLEQTSVVSAKSSSQPQSSYAIAESLTEFELKKILMEKMKKSQSYQTADVHKILYDGLVNSYLLDKDHFESYGQTVSLKRNHEEDKDEDPSAGLNQGKESKKRRTRKEATSSNISSTPKEPTKGKPQSKSSKTGKSASADQSVKEHEHEPEVLDPEWNTVKAIDDTHEQPWFNQMIDNITREVLMGPVFNLLKGTYKSCVELEYNMEECYWALTDQLDWTNPEGHLRSVDMSNPPPLQDKEGRLVIPVEFFFNNNLEYLIAGNKERTYSSSITKAPTARARINTVSKYKVFSTMRILSVVSVQVEKKHDYGYLKEFVVRRADQNLYKFKEGVALRMFTQELYTPNYDPQGVIYEDKKKRKRLMRVDELHKFSDGTLQFVHKTLLHRLKNFRLGYNRNSDMPRREWTEKDQKHTRYVLRKIDDQLLRRRIMRSLEVLVGGRNTETDRRLLQRTDQFRRASLTGFPAQSVRSSNAIALDSPYSLVLIIETSQSRYHESRKSPTKSLFDVGSRRISIVTVNTKEYHSDVLAIITRIMQLPRFCKTFKFLRRQDAYTKATNQISESIHWKSFAEEVGQLVIRLDKIQFNRTFFHVFLYEMVADSDAFCSRVLDRVAGYGYG